MYDVMININNNNLNNYMEVCKLTSMQVKYVIVILLIKINL
jgi:hypothetical protein